jgi:hypothetical protein
MAAAWVDDSLRSCLEAYLARDSRIAKGLLGPDQPLGSFGVKIKVAYLLGLIDDEMRADADVIRSVRNDFAHFRSRISWSDRSVADPPGLPPLQPLPDTPPPIIGQNQVVLALRCPTDPSPRRSLPLHENPTGGLVRPIHIGAFDPQGETDLLRT